MYTYVPSFKNDAQADAYFNQQRVWWKNPYSSPYPQPNYNSYVLRDNEGNTYNAPNIDPQYQGHAIQFDGKQSPYQSAFDGKTEVNQNGRKWWLNTGNNGGSYSHDAQGRKVYTLGNGQQFVADA